MLKSQAPLRVERGRAGRLIHAAEVCFAELCKPGRCRHWDEDSNTNDDMPATGGPTHVHLGSTNQWCPCPYTCVRTIKVLSQCAQRRDFVF